MSGFLVSVGVYVDGGDTPFPPRPRMRPREEKPQETAAWVIPTGEQSFFLGYLGQEPVWRLRRSMLRMETGGLKISLPPEFVEPISMVLWQPQPAPSAFIPPANTGAVRHVSYTVSTPTIDPMTLGPPWLDAGNQVRIPVRRGRDTNTPNELQSLFDAPTIDLGWHQDAYRELMRKLQLPQVPEMIRPRLDAEDVTLAWLGHSLPGVPNPRSRPLPQGDLPPLSISLDVGVWMAGLRQSEEERVRKPVRVPMMQSDTALDGFTATPVDQFFGWEAQQPQLAKRLRFPASGSHSYTTSDASLLNNVSLAFMQSSPSPKRLGNWLAPEMVGNPEAWLSGANIITVGGPYWVPIGGVYTAGADASAVPQSKVNAMRVILGGVVSAAGGVTLMARVVGNAGSPVTQATLSTITYVITETIGGTAIASGSFTISSTVFNSLQQADPRWTFDSVYAPGPDGNYGYNFLGTLGASNFPITTASAVPYGYPPLPPKEYEIDVKFTPSSGEVVKQTWKITVPAIFG